MTRANKNALRLLSLFIASQSLVLYAQTAPPIQTPAVAPTLAAPDKPPLSKQELEQLLAPLALYPDDLLTQVLMASTYPLEIVQADRWLKTQSDTKSDAFAKALEAQPWDASVKSIVNFPDVLKLMSDKLDLTIKIGDAFIAQQPDVLNTVQILRNKAQAAGNLKSSDQVKVTVEPAPAPDPQVVVVQAAPPQVITIESASPSVVYVPTYNPTIVYGSWPYPAYPPYPYYPPYPAGYVATAAVSFGLGVAAGAAWGYAWGHSNWGHGDVDINVNRNNNFNRNIDRSKYQGGDRTNNIGNGNRAGAGGAGGNRSTWQHNPAHRDGVPYSNKAAANKFGGASNAQAAQARDAYRGRSDTGRQNLQSGAGQGGGLQNRPNTGQVGAGQNRPNTGQVGAGQNRPNTGQVGAGQNRPNTGQVGAGQNRPAGGQAGARPAQQPANRPSTGASGGAFGGVNSSGSAARSASQRGSTSRSSPAPRSTPAASSGGAARGGGASRGGGGRR